MKSTYKMLVIWDIAHEWKEKLPKVNNGPVDSHRGLVEVLLGLMKKTSLASSDPKNAKFRIIYQQRIQST